jgi:replicative DNA helicase
MEGETFSLVDTIVLHHNKTEQLFAGGVMLDPVYARETCAWLDPRMIRDEKLRRYWDLVRNGREPADAAMEAQCYLDVLEHMNQVVSLFHIPHFAKGIAEDVFLHESADRLGEMARAIAERKTEELRKLSQSIFENVPSSGAKIPTAAEVGLEFNISLDDVETIMLPTGIATLDAKMGGIEKQSLVIIGGRPGMGKTVAGLQVAVENARQKRRVIYFSLEMSRRSLWARLACGAARVDWRLIKSRTARPEMVKAVEDESTNLINEIGDYLLIDDSPMTTNEDIFKKVGEYKPELIVVDHLDLVNRQERGKLNEVIRVGNISRMGKIIAKQFNIPAVYLMQLNRDTEKRDNKRPQLSDIRASGEVEQDADIVLFLYRPDYYQEEENKLDVVDAEIWLEKVRDGKAHIMAQTKLDLVAQRFYPIDYKAVRRW